MMFIYFYYLLIFNLLSIFDALSGCTLYSRWYSLDRAVARLRLTGWRLGAAAAFLHYLSNPHFPPPLRQTARYLLAFYRECCPFYYFVGLHSIVGTVLNSETLSACTSLSVFPIRKMLYDIIVPYFECN